jgi:hypothetical protein
MLGRKASFSWKHRKNDSSIVFRISLRFMKHNSRHALELGD